MINRKQADEIIRRYRQEWPVEGDRGLQHPVAAVNHDDIPMTGERLIINSQVRTVPVLAEHLLRYDWACRFASGQIVLDAACGAGYGAKMLEMAGAKQVHAVDLSQESLQHAEAVYAGDRITFRQADLRRLPYANETFDMVVSFESIEHIPEGSQWIAESARVLKQDGLLLISTPNRYKTNAGLYFEEEPFNPFHFFEYAITEFVGELLVHYDILELYGQSLIFDQDDPAFLYIRQLKQHNQIWHPDPAPAATGHKLIPLSQIKNAQPEFVVALCRKKALQ